MLKLLFFTAIGVSELVSIRVEQIDGGACKFSSSKERARRIAVSCTPSHAA
jgi:hypothetical protein